ncbi:MAG: hypothetical protein IPI33_15565 [Dehalococcoidia bacterium]|nr:hypothetical protein [Dehalococcoidia bacterium]
MRKTPRVLLAALMFGMVPASAEIIPISHEPLTCIPVDSSARVAAGTAASEAVSSARVYFRPEGIASDYFVEMRRGTGDNWVGFLPSAASPDTVITYRIEMKDSEGVARRTAPTRVQASVSCPARMSDEDKRMSKNLVLGLTASGQPVVPAGFTAAGIVARISPEGDLQTLPPGTVVAAAAPLSPVASRTGPSPACVGCGTLTIGGTSGVGVGGGVIPGPTPPPVSPIRPTSGKS